MSYEKDMYIDVTALDVEWTEQANLAMKYARLWADAKDEFDRAEENVKLVRSELILAINADPEKYLGKDVRLTDPKVEACYRVHPKHIKAKERWLAAMKELNIIEVAKNEICFTRKAALENLVTLHGQGYFAGPKVPRNLKQEVEQYRKARDLRGDKADSKMKPFVRRRRDENSEDED